MSEKRTSLEVIAPSVEEAVAKGLGDLGLTEEAVDVEVLDTGSRGLFGLGYRQARVRLTIKGAVAEEPEYPPMGATPAATPLPRVSTPMVADASSDDDDFVPEAELPAVEMNEEQAFMVQVARETVEELLGKMKVQASVSARMGRAEDEQDRAPVLVDVTGNDLSILIGPKAETLNALQYIAGLIVGKEIGHSIPLVVDVEGYRARRYQQIRQIAERMAEQAVRTGKRQVLEPMPASERRLIHIALRNNPQVTTESQGDEPRRKVTIVPK